MFLFWFFLADSFDIKIRDPARICPTLLIDQEVLIIRGSLAVKAIEPGRMSCFQPIKSFGGWCPSQFKWSAFVLAKTSSRSIICVRSRWNVFPNIGFDLIQFVRDQQLKIRYFHKNAAISQEIYHSQFALTESQKHCVTPRFKLTKISKTFCEAKIFLVTLSLIYTTIHFC